MEGVPDDIGSIAAATVSQTVSAMLEKATAAAVAASSIPGTTEEIPGLDTGSISATGFPQTQQSNKFGSGRTTEATASEATTTVPPLSSLGLIVEDTMSGVELSGRRGGSGEEGNETDVEWPDKDGARTNTAGANRRAQGELEPVVLPGGGRAFCDETPGNKRGEDEELGDEGDECNEVPGGEEIAEEKEEGEELDGGEEQEEKKDELVDCSDGRVVHYARPEDGATVLVSGRREGAVVQVAEQVLPVYQLTVSVRVASSTLIVAERTSGQDFRSNYQLPNIARPAERGAEEPTTVEEDIAGVVSLSLGKSDIKAALESWARSSAAATADGGATITPRSASLRGTGVKNATPNRDGATTGAPASPPAPEPVDADLRRWITTGRAPRRTHLVDWLLRRLELVKTDDAEDWNSEAASREARQQERPRYSLVISKDHATAGKENDVDNKTNRTSATKTSTKGGITGSGDGRMLSSDNKVNRQQSGRAAGENEEEEGGKEGVSAQTWDRASTAVAAAGSIAAVPRVAFPQLAAGGERVDQQWQWWDSENPWSRGSGSSTSTDAKSSSESAPPPPVYREVGPPPSYQEVFAGPRTPRSSLFSSKTATSNKQAPGMSSPLSKGGSQSSGDDTSRGSPPSYRTAAAGRETGSFSSSCGREEEGNRVARDLPPPSYGRYYEDLHSAQVLSPARRETGDGSPKSEASEWGAQEAPQDLYRPRPDTDRDSGRGQERELRRRRRSGSSVRGGGYQTFDRPETVDDEGGDDGEGGDVLLGTSWARRKHGGERKRSSTLAMDGRNRPRTTTSLSRRTNRHSEPPLSGADSWDDDRWRLTRYLGACKRELAEAEERRRRAEAAANAAERSAWAAGKDNGDDAAKRAWAKAATQRVLDLMLVTERVRQEEQKRRVAAARANSQVARCKQPFRERRGRSQKGPFIGPSVPPAGFSEPSRSQQRAEESAALKDFYWDEHGRRYTLRGGIGDGIDDQESSLSGEVGVAMEAVRKVAMTCLEEGGDFSQPFRDMDSSGNGRLTLAELGAALRRVGVRLSLSQVTALFRHFDEGHGFDTVGRREFLWEFVDRGRLLKQWMKAGDVRGGHRARTAPFRNRAKRASYVGGDGGTLSRHNVLRALEELEVRVDGWEADALLDRFALEDGHDKVDWLALVSFMQAAENNEDGANTNNNINDSPTSGRKQSTVRGRRERPGLRSTFARDSSRPEKQHWATSGLGRGQRGFFHEKGADSSWGRSTRSTKIAPPKTGTKPSPHWASSAMSSVGGWRNKGTFASDTYPATKTTPRARDVSSWEEVTATGDSTPTLLRSRGAGGRERERGHGTRGGKLVANVAEASRLLDGLLEEQQELEAFLEEEFAKREREQGRE